MKYDNGLTTLSLDELLEKLLRVKNEFHVPGNTPVAMNNGSLGPIISVYESKSRLNGKEFTIVTLERTE